MNYIAITEIGEIPQYQEPKQYSSEEIPKIMAEALFRPIDMNKQDVPIPAYLQIKLSEETFKFIESVATIEVPVFGEKEYKINDLKFQIYTEEEYEKRYGKLKLIKMKVIETHEFYNSDHDDASRVTVKIETIDDAGEVSFGEGESEDMYLFRDLSDAYSISDLLKIAYDAGKSGEEFEYELVEERD